MTDVLDGILDDLRVGMARRAARRRRVRAAGATALTSLALVAAGVGALSFAGQTSATSGSSSTVAAHLITSDDCTVLACWHADASLNVPKQRMVSSP